MTKAELIQEVHQKATDNGHTMTKKQVGEMVDAMFSILSGAICQDNRFTYPGFGTFTVKDRKAREGRNPRTGEPIQIPASKTVGFKPAPKLKETLMPAPKKSAKKSAKKAALKKKTAKKVTKKTTKKNTKKK